MKSWLSPAKLNLFLYITGRRQDNYHDLQTLFQFIDYNDKLSFEIRDDDQIKLVTHFKTVPEDKNLIVIAAKRLQNYIQQTQSKCQPLGVNINIEKKIPMGGGLGGASSNAATVLVALNHLWNINLSKEKLIEIGKPIGSDVAIFIYGHAAFAEGVGDKLQSVNLAENWYLVTHPNIEISTAKIFNLPETTRNTAIRTIDQLLEIPFKQHVNDCEIAVRNYYPEIDHLITFLSEFAPTRLTGTGACLFTQCKNKSQAEYIQSQLANKSENSFIAKSHNLSPLYTRNHSS